MNRPRGYMVDFCPRCRARMPRATAEQHGALQAVLEDIALQKDWPPGSGNFRGPRKWWPLVVAAFDRLKEQEVEILPAIDGIGFDGNGFDIVRGERLRRNVNNVEVSEIIEYARAWAIDQGVKLREFKDKKKAA